VKKLSIIFLFFSITFQAFAFDKVFLQTAKIAGTGGAVTSTADDLATFMYNPAGLSRLNSIQLMGDLFNLYQAGFENTLIGLYYPLFLNGGMGIVWKRIDAERALDFENIEDTYFLIIAKEFFGINLGLGTKYLKEYTKNDDVKLDDSDYEIDFGVQEKYKNLQFGISFLNTLKFLNLNKSNISSTINIGMSIRLIEELSISLDYKNIEKENEISIGAEYNPVEEVILRAGYYINFYYAFGFSYYIRRVRVDYTFSISQYSIGTTHYFGIIYTYTM